MDSDIVHTWRESEHLALSGNAQARTWHLHDVTPHGGWRPKGDGGVKNRPNLTDWRRFVLYLYLRDNSSHSNMAKDQQRRGFQRFLKIVEGAKKNP